VRQVDHADIGVLPGVHELDILGEALECSIAVGELNDAIA
jgi:hypothetical protein